MKMKTYDTRSPIHGDSNLGYWNEGPRPENHVPDSDYKIKWPEGYWELYDDLRRAAQDISGALVIHMVMGRGDKYRVYALMPPSKAIREGGAIWGPEMSDRNQAWKAFISGFIPKTIVIPAGEVQLGSPNRNGDSYGIPASDIKSGLAALANGSYAPSVRNLELYADDAVAAEKNTDFVNGLRSAKSNGPNGMLPKKLKMKDEDKGTLAKLAVENASLFDKKLTDPGITVRTPKGRQP